MYKFKLKKMKTKNLILVVTLFMTLVACSQDAKNKFIEVTGSAEMEVVPDQVELEIVLISPGNSKQAIENMDKEISEALKNNGIPESALMFVEISNPYYWYYHWWWEKNYYDSKTYQLKLDCNKYNLDFIKDIKPEHINNIRIVKSTHSKITEYRSDVKVNAIIAAKEKAELLLKSIGGELGEILEIIEIVEPANSYWYYNNTSIYSNCMVAQPDYSYSQLETILPTIKLRYEIKTKFEIK